MNQINWLIAIFVCSAIRVLRSANVILSEDTRHSGKLLQYYNIKAHLVSFFFYFSYLCKAFVFFNHVRDVLEFMRFRFLAQLSQVQRGTKRTSCVDSIETGRDCRPYQRRRDARNQ